MVATDSAFLSVGLSRHATDERTAIKTAAVATVSPFRIAVFKLEISLRIGLWSSHPTLAPDATFGVYGAGMILLC